MFWPDIFVICYSTPNYAPLANHCAESLLRLGLPRAQLHWWVDDSFAETDGSFRTSLWYHSVSQKILHLIVSLDLLVRRDIAFAGKWILFTDMDVQYFGPSHLWSAAALALTTHEVMFLREGATDEVNSGVFFIRATPDVMRRASAFFQRVLARMKERTRESMPYGDQTIVNELLPMSGLDVGFLPDAMVGFGRNCPRTALFHHAVAAGSMGAKLEQQRDVLFQRLR